MARKGENSCSDIEAGHTSMSMENESDVSLSDSEEQSWHSPYDDNDENDTEIDRVEEVYRNSTCLSECSYEVDLEKNERDCRICHLSLESRDSGVSIVLGCLCKDDLGSAHKQCAETWFKIKGNKTCEICGSTAKNVLSAGETELIEHSNETNSAAVTPAHPVQARNFWQGHRFLNFMLACIIFAFVISWLFHFNVPG